MSVLQRTDIKLLLVMHDVLGTFTTWTCRIILVRVFQTPQIWDFWYVFFYCSSSFLSCQCSCYH